MPRQVALRELLVGVEGLALLRHLYDGTDEAAGRRLDEVVRILQDDSLSEADTIEEADVAAGYTAWAGSYDAPGNPIIAIEQPAVWAILDSLGPGRALDAACGTGRHGAHLVQAGHRVVGVDLASAMLGRARSRLPSLASADLRALPFPSARFDLVVCGLALAHVPDLHRAVVELARTLAPGGHVVISVLHPLQAYLGWHAPFEDASGRRGFVREHAHSHSDYFDALRAAGLALLDCREPRLTSAEVRAKRRAFRHIPDAALAAYEGLPGVLVLHARRP